MLHQGQVFLVFDILLQNLILELMNECVLIFDFLFLLIKFALKGGFLRSEFGTDSIVSFLFLKQRFLEFDKFIFLGIE